MRQFALAFTTLLLMSPTYAQDDPRAILSVDPEMANGYFIIDKDKAAQLMVASLNVNILAAKKLSNGTTGSRILETIMIRDGHFGKLNPTLLSTMEEGETAHYHLTALTADGTVVVERDPAFNNGGWAWPEQCRLTCRSNLYAWTLKSYADNGQHWIELVNGTVDGGYFYFYVPDDLWWDFENANPDASAFGLEHDWTHHMMQPWPAQNDMVYVPDMPDDALMLNGYGVSANYAGAGWAIRLDRGPWRDLHAWTDTYSNSSTACTTLRERNNSDPLVQANMGNDISPLTCAVLPTIGGGVSWGGSGPFNPCGQASLWSPGINGNAAAYAQAFVDCHRSQNEGGQTGTGGIHSVSIHQLRPESSTVIINGVFPSNKDPKLVPIPKTVLEPGLYETRIVLDDGRILRHYEDLSVQATVHADFSSFVDITIYPVPVADRTFAVDFDLLYPTSMTMTVVNNMGETYHIESLDFPISGRNKHVVRMNTQWPDGLYHSIFQFSSGSSQSVSFLVDF